MNTNSNTERKCVSFTEVVEFFRHAPEEEVAGVLLMLPRVRTHGAPELRQEAPTQRAPRQPKCNACGQGFTKTGKCQRYCKRAECARDRVATYQRKRYRTTHKIRPNGDAHALPTVQEAASAVSA